MTGINGEDRGPLGFKFLPDHEAVEARHRRLGCACLLLILAGVAVALLLCGAGAAVWGLR